MLRFYNQVGLLIEKRLVDEDFVYALVGARLESAGPGIKVAVEYYQNYDAGDTGTEKAPAPRPVHVYVPKLYAAYQAWARMVATHCWSSRGSAPP